MVMRGNSTGAMISASGVLSMLKNGSIQEDIVCEVLGR